MVFEPRTPRIKAIAGTGKASTDIEIPSRMEEEKLELLQVKPVSRDIEYELTPIEEGTSFNLRVTVDTGGA